MPLAVHVKSYYKLNKKLGSTDRRQVSHLCYSYYRIGKLLAKMPLANRITAALYLCSPQPNSLLQQLNAAYNDNATLTMQEKLAALQQAQNSFGDSNAIFPLYENISTQLDIAALLQNQLQQPYLYIRIRPKHLAKVLLTLQQLTVSYKIYDPFTIQLPNGFKVQDHFILNKEVVVQDYASQKVMDNLLKVLKPKHNYTVWDCCAASGGKSILLTDLYQGSLNLFVTDVRTSILENLEKRFFTARISNYKVAEHNLAKSPLGGDLQFEVIVCDVPCSGSGTWARTPEQLVFFKAKQLESYTFVQKKIALNAAQNLRPGGHLLYVTCSIFTAENEQVVAHILQHTKLILVQTNYITGYKHQADTMYTALLTLPL